MPNLKQKVNKDKKRASLKAAQKRILEKKFKEKNKKMYSTKDTPMPVPFVEGASTMAPPSGAGPMLEMQEPSTSGEAQSVQTQ